MALSYLLGPIPFWVLMDTTGRAAGGAKLYTYRSLNKSEKKPVYQDAGASNAWTNPIIFDLNGTQGPFYWEIDSTAPEETYYLVATDSDDNELWTIDDYLPPSSGGGGSNVTTYLPLANMICNNQFIDHVDDIIGNIAPNNSIPTDNLITASNHKGFTPALINPVVGTYGVLGPDIRFVKNNTDAADRITFETFSLGSTDLTGDSTPVQYVRYQCTNVPVGETFKCFQFPIAQKIQNLSSVECTFTIWAKADSVVKTLKLYSRQYYGSGNGATPESGATRQLIQTWTLTNTWAKYTVDFSFPNVVAGSLGAPGQQTDDDATYLQLEMPLGALADISFIKPCLFLGVVDPDAELDTYDYIQSVEQTPRTGDVKAGYLASAPRGWVSMNDGSIGNAGSGATTANQNTFQLYKTIWDSVSNTWAPVSTGRGASAIADFVAGKTLTLPRALGRALCEAGTGAGLTARVLGEYLGEETHVLTVPEIPSHSHSADQGAASGVGGAQRLTNNASGGAASTGATGGGGAHNNMQPSTFMNFYIKL